MGTTYVVCGSFSGSFKLHGYFDEH